MFWLCIQAAIRKESKNKIQMQTHVFAGATWKVMEYTGVVCDVNA